VERGWAAVVLLLQHSVLLRGKRPEVKYEDLLWPNGDAWAVSYTTTKGALMTPVRISVTSTPGSRTWYTGMGTPGGNQVDLMSVLIHEMATRSS
jgi:hypothetical protein